MTFGCDPDRLPVGSLELADAATQMGVLLLPRPHEFLEEEIDDDAVERQGLLAVMQLAYAGQIELLSFRDGFWAQERRRRLDFLDGECHWSPGQLTAQVLAAAEVPSLDHLAVTHGSFQPIRDAYFHEFWKAEQEIDRGALMFAQMRSALPWVARLDRLQPPPPAQSHAERRTGKLGLRNQVVAAILVAGLDPQMSRAHLERHLRRLGLVSGKDLILPAIGSKPMHQVLREPTLASARRAACAVIDGKKSAEAVFSNPGIPTPVRREAMAALEGIIRTGT